MGSANGCSKDETSCTARSTWPKAASGSTWAGELGRTSNASATASTASEESMSSISRRRFWTQIDKLSADGFSREVLGHEMARAIMSHYFVIQPPLKIQEVMGMYVQYNLRKNAK